jgi:hypothetical protein
MPDKSQPLLDNTAILLDMSITRALAVAVAFASVFLGFASPARADQVLQGIYTYTQEGIIPTTWTIYPSCVPTVGDLRDNLELPVACRLHVAATPSTQVSGGDARLTGGRWQFTTNKLNAMACPDGVTKAPLLETYTFDDVTMTGTRSVSNNDVCNGAVLANIETYPFTLAYKEPLSIPNQQYPLYCEPGGLKRCF